MAEQRPMLLRGVTVLDGTGRPPVAGLDIRIEGGRIVALARGLAVEGCEVFEAGESVVLPGLIDAHVHLVFSGEADAEARIRNGSLPVIAWDAARNARATVEAGVTTVRDLGSTGGIAQALRDEVAARGMVGPRIRAAGQVICMTGGHGWWVGHEADGPEGVRKAVREELKAGADCIKFIATGGVMTPRVDPRSPQLGEDEMRAGVEEAHKAFARVAAHAQATEGIKNAVRAGVDSIEHGVYLDDEAVEMMRERGTFLVPTLSAPHNISVHGIAAGIPDFMVAKSDMVRETHRESFKRALRAGVRIAMGTDAGTPFNLHGGSAAEVRHMVDCGMAPVAAIAAATRDAADLLGLLDETGAIEVGKSADLLLVAGDPVVDVGVLAQPVAVMARGRWVRGNPTSRPDL